MEDLFLWQLMTGFGLEAEPTQSEPKPEIVEQVEPLHPDLEDMYQDSLTDGIGGC